MSFTDAVSRISQIQALIASVQTAFDPSVASGATQSDQAALAPSSSTYTSNDSATFANALAQAQNTGDSRLDGSRAFSPRATSPAITPPISSLATTLPATSLPASAQTMLTGAQQQFAFRLAADTGLDPAVITSWLLAEESGDAAQARQSANNNDWLNIGYTDSGTYGSSDTIWSDPTTAADATAGWLQGQNTIPGYGTASSGIQSILATADQSPTAQIAAIQQSGWASSGYSDLTGLYQQVAD